MKEKIQVGYVGLGRRGTLMLNNCFGEMDDVEIAALCELDGEKLEKGREALEKKGRPAPALYTDYSAMLQHPGLDAVVIMTGWNARVKYAIEAMRAGKYTAIEVGCAYDLSECFDLVKAYEETGVPVMMLENCCYGRREMMALRMVKEGLFGEIVQCCGGYRHYLNEEDLVKRREDGTLETNHYRLTEYLHRNCEQYPTHELGPISKVLNINRGNRMISLQSFATKSVGLAHFMQEKAPDHPWAGKKFAQSDIVTTVIGCAGGEQIILTLDTTLPRPFYSRDFTVRGTKGMCMESGGGHVTYYLEGMSEPVFDNEKEFFEKYDHPLHAEYANQERGGHGGMDWLVSRAFVESVKRGIQTPIDAYDTAAWLAIAPLSEASLACGRAVEFPDFTRGKWFCREAALESKYSLDLIVEDKETSIF